jgi:hypothetical protein
MAGLNGTFAKVTVSGSSAVTVARLGTWAVNDARALIEIEPFGSTKTEILGGGIRRISGTFTGWLDVEDTTGQEILRDAYESNTAISGVQFWVSNSRYYTTGNDFYILSFASTAAQGAAITLEGTFSCSDWDLV